MWGHVFIIISYLYTISISLLFEQAREILVQIAYAFSCFKNKRIGIWFG